VSRILLAVALVMLAGPSARDVWLWRHRDEAPARLALPWHPAT
jgi:hypothetical protein